ncbi:hypothetical protein [Amycolatopsis jejuensis]|uniref:hypothetical protein n=1 Tax=Amycolatopsis jejuensis TaxID=330084 RepID=UPI0012E086C2|nr:hypothetical protein [Amycolatopsis jejuensis]
MQQPVPLPPDLDRLVGQVAALHPFVAAGPGSVTEGFLHLRKVALGRFEPRARKPSGPSREVLESTVLFIAPEGDEEYIQDYYESSESTKDLRRERIRLYGHWYRLEWLSGSVRDQVLSRYFE